MRLHLLNVLAALLCLTTQLHAQDYLSTRAVESEGYGAYASIYGHNIPIPGVCGHPSAYAHLVSADQAPAAQFPNMKAAFKCVAGGTGFEKFRDSLSHYGYTLEDIEMKFTTMTLGDDIQGEDWFVVGVNETRFYHNGTFTFYVGGHPIVTGYMPVLQIEIDYNAVGNCTDDIVGGITQYTAIRDSSQLQSDSIQGIAAGFLADVGSNGIRFNFSNMEPAVQGTSGAVFEAPTGKVEIGPLYDDMSSTSVSEPSTNVCTTPSSTVTSTGSGTWLHVLDGTDRVVSILDSEPMGAITTDFYLNSGTVRTTGDLEYMDRNFRITPSTQPTGNVRVRLYFTSTDWTNFTAASPDSLAFMSDMVISKFDNSDCDSIGNASGEVTVPILDYGYIPTDQSYYVDIQISSFSAFFIHGPKESPVLPVELMNFNGQSTEGGNLLTWQTAVERDNDGFEIQRSTDATNWASIAWIKGEGTSFSPTAYNYTDKEVSQAKLVYYRLKQMDYNGNYDYSPVISIANSTNSESIGKFYPNPNQTGIVNLDYYSEKNKTVSFKVYTVTGQLVLENLSSLDSGSNTLTFNYQELGKGIFIIKIGDEGQAAYRKLIID